MGEMLCMICYGGDIMEVNYVGYVMEEMLYRICYRGDIM